MNKEKQRRNAEIYRPMCEELFNNLEKQYQELAKVKAEGADVKCSFFQNTANVVPKSEGEWIDLYKGKYANPLYACSVCEKGTLLRVEGNELGQPQTVQALSPYCPNCAAKMKGGG